MEEGGKTIEGDNKWLTLMHNAIQYQKTAKSLNNYNYLLFL